MGLWLKLSMRGDDERGMAVGTKRGERVKSVLCELYLVVCDRKLSPSRLTLRLRRLVLE